ncbi:MAG: dihydrolipoyl dehydrogenase [Acidaminobacteraceae bacterium]
MYDIAIIGGGPGGYVAAIKAAQLGNKVVLIEKDKVGGVCLNYGCIPTKTLLHSAKLYDNMLNSYEYGILIEDKSSIKIDWSKMLERKDSVVNKLVTGVEGLLKKNGVDVIYGVAKLVTRSSLVVDSKKFEYKNLVIATGSSVMNPEIKGLKESIESGYSIDSTGAISLDKVPKSMIILGGGVISIEFATLYNNLGCEVTIIQRSSELLKFLDKDVRNLIQRHLSKKGVNIITDTSITEISNGRVKFENKGKAKEVTAEKILVSLGRKPNISGFEELNLKTDKNGVIVDDHMQTNIDHIYAIGDVNGKYMLAHVASAEGIVAINHIMGESEKINYNKIPSCIYSSPEVGVVGLTEEEAIEKGYDVIVSKFPLSANGKALAEGESTGFVKLVADKTYGEVLGVHIVASHATDMIAEAVATMELEGTIHDLAKTVHPHPTLSEIVMEAAHGAIDKPIHM